MDAVKNFPHFVGGTSGLETDLLFPDADLDASGWTVAPLWSKVNEPSPDGVVISAVPS